jgi:hypothetical protein
VPEDWLGTRRVHFFFIRGWGGLGGGEHLRIRILFCEIFGTLGRGRGGGLRKAEKTPIPQIKSHTNQN